MLPEEQVTVDQGRAHSVQSEHDKSEGEHCRMGGCESNREDPNEKIGGQ